jgi:hypothetical protein
MHLSLSYLTFPLARLQNRVAVMSSAARDKDLVVKDLDIT